MTYTYPTPCDLDRMTVEAIAALGVGNSRSVFDWVVENYRAAVSPRDCGQSLKRNAEAGRVIRHGKNAAAKHTLA